MKYLTSAFSLQMVPEGADLEIRNICQDTFRGECRGWHRGYGVVAGFATTDYIDAIGHEGTAVALSAILGRKVGVNRLSITLEDGDCLLVAQPTGKRIAYGKELDMPELSFFIVRVYYPGQMDEYKSAAREECV